MPQGTLWYQPIQRMFQGGTNTVPNAKAYFFLAGTSTPVNVFADVGLTIMLTQPVIADANGVFVEIFLTPGTAYKVDVQTATGASLPGYPADNQLAVPSSSSNVAQSGTAGEAIAAGQPVYLSDGSGGKIAGQWYVGDATTPYSSSVAQVVGIASAGIAVGASGTFITGGQVGGLIVTPGSDYYIGVRGLTTSLPLNARYLGRADSVSTLVVQDQPGLLTSPVIRMSIVTPVTSPLGHGVCQGRLTLVSGTPVSVADVTGASATTTYFTPYRGNNIGLYDGVANWTILPFTELSLPVLTATNTNIDVFIYSNNGAPTMELAAWSSDTTRLVPLVLQNGVYVKSGQTTRRYVGTYRVGAVVGQSEDSMVRRYVWSYDNRVRRLFFRPYVDSGGWTYTTPTIRQANANPANQVEVLIGMAEVPVDLSLLTIVNNSVGGASVDAGMGIDSTTALAAAGLVRGFINVSVGANVWLSLPSHLITYPTVGRHVYTMLEYSSATGVTTWQGSGYGAGMSGYTEG